MATADDMRRRRADPEFRQREKDAAEARRNALVVENQQLRERVATLTGWPLLEGFKAAREGRAFDRTRSPEWQAGFWRFKRGQRK